MSLNIINIMINDNIPGVNTPSIFLLNDEPSSLDFYELALKIINENDAAQWLPVDGRKRPVNIETGAALEGWTTKPPNVAEIKAALTEKNKFFKALGLHPGNDFISLDIDSSDGYKFLREILEPHGVELPENIKDFFIDTLGQSSNIESKRHYIFRNIHGITTKTALNAVEVRTGLNYCNVAGVHPTAKGGRYLTFDHPIADAPDWLPLVHAATRKQTTPATLPPPPPSATDQPDHPDHVCLLDLLPPAVVTYPAAGDRHNVGFKLMGYLLYAAEIAEHLGINHDTPAESLHLWNSKLTEPREAEKIDRIIDQKSLKPIRVPYINEQLIRLGYIKVDHDNPYTSTKTQGLEFTEQNPKTGATKSQRIGEHLELEAVTTDEQGERLNLSFLGGYRGQEERRVIIPRHTLAGNGVKALELLFNAGYHVNIKSLEKRLIEYLGRLGGNDYIGRRLTVTEKTGWVNGSFVLRGRTYGDQNLVNGGLYDKPELEILGSVDNWRQTVGRLAIGNNRLMLVILHALAAPLLDLCEIKNGVGGIHLHGLSSTGKSTLLMVSALFCGRSHHETWRATSNGMESIAARYNNQSLQLDEIAEVENLGDIIYMLCNGRGKQRMTKRLEAQRRSDWNINILSSGEVTVDSHIKQGRKNSRPMAGQEVRLLNIPATPEGSCYGVFQTLHEFTKPQHFITYLNKNCRLNRGVVFDAYIEKLQKAATNAEQLAAIVDRLDVITADLISNYKNESATRAGRYMAALQLAGELATNWNITTWTTDQVNECVKMAFNDWILGRGGDVNIQHSRATNALKQKFQELQFSDRMPKLTPGKLINDIRTGSAPCFAIIDGKETIITSLTFRAFCEEQSVQAGNFAAHLITAGYMKPADHNRKTSSPKAERVAGDVQRCYRFFNSFYSIWNDDEEEPPTPPTPPAPPQPPAPPTSPPPSPPSPPLPPAPPSNPPQPSDALTVATPATVDHWENVTAATPWECYELYKNHITVDDDALPLDYEHGLALQPWEPTISIDSYENTRRVIIDIETTGLDPATSRVLMIGLKSGGVHTVIYNTDERELLNEFWEKLKAIRPQILIGHNLFNFDIPYIAKRTQVNDLYCPFFRGIKQQTISASSMFGKPISFMPWYISKDDKYLGGCQIIDTMHQIAIWDKSAAKLRSYKLKDSVIDLGLREDRRLELTADQINQHWDDCNYSIISDYLKFDLDDTEELADYLLPVVWMQQRYIPGLTFQRLATASPALKTQLIYKALYAGEPEPEADKTATYEGGLIECNNPGIYRNIAKIDISSLYPSIMLRYGLCSHKDREKRFLSVLSYMREARLNYKSLAKKGDKSADHMQNALKVLINGAYGFLGTVGFSYNSYPAAALVPAYGRKILRVMRDELERAGAVVIECDTDGIIFTPPRNMTAEEMNARINNILPAGIDADLEFSECGGYIPKSKSYIIAHPNGKYELKGFYKKRGLSYIERDFTIDYVKLWFESTEKAEEFFNETMNQLKGNEYPIEKLKITRKISTSEKAIVAAGIGKPGDHVTFYYGYNDRGKLHKVTKGAYNREYYINSIIEQRAEILGITPPPQPPQPEAEQFTLNLG